MITKKNLGLALLAMLTLAACRKNDDETPDNDYTSAIDNSLAEDYFNDMLEQADDAAAQNGLRDTDDPCAPTVTINTDVMPHTMLIDFGPTDCTALNGRTRRGQIMVTFTGGYRDPGTVITLTPIDYYVNDNHVEGLKTVTNMGENADGDTYFAIQVDGTITAGDGSWTAEHHATRTRTWIQGEDTPNPFDDVYIITGNGHGVNRHDIAYTLDITSGLRVEIGCPWIVSGTVSITPDGHATRYVDFGSGSCDDVVSVTVNGTTFTFHMH
jgi:hypothetical protein